MTNQNEIECPDCDGVGTLEDRKGIEYTCPACKGKGSIRNEREKSKAEKGKEV